MDIHKFAREEGFHVPRSQVAITLSPKLSRPECSLYPVEGNWDLFFCFLEAEDSVSLGVRHIHFAIHFVDYCTYR